MPPATSRTWKPAGNGVLMARVTLLTYTPQPEKTVAMAAKLCYSPSAIDEIGEGLTEEKTASFVQMLADIGHESPIEHASFTFGQSVSNIIPEPVR